MASPLPRPRQIQLSGWLIIVGSLFTLVGAFDQVRAIGSLEMTEQIERQLERPLFDGITVTIDQVEQTIRAMSFIGAICASTMAILAWQMLQQRSRSARAWLTALAVPTFIAGLASDGLMTTIVVIAVGFLWTQPARRWFDGTWKPEPAQAQRPGVQRDAVQAPVRAPESPAQPAPQPVSAQASAPSPTNAPQPPPMPSWPPTAAAPAFESAPVPSARPHAVVGAAVLTWVFSLLSAVAFITVIAVIALDPERVMEEMRRINPELMAQEEITQGMVQAMFVFLGGIVFVWSASACILAFLVMRRIGWARTVLVVCASAAGLVLLIAATASPLMLAPFLAASATVGLLLRRDVGAWLTRR